MLHCKLSLTMAIKTENDMVAVSTEQVISDNYCYLQFFRHTNYVCLEIFFYVFLLSKEWYVDSV